MIEMFTCADSICNHSRLIWESYIPFFFFYGCSLSPWGFEMSIHSGESDNIKTIGFHLKKHIWLNAGEIKQSYLKHKNLCDNKLSLYKCIFSIDCALQYSSLLKIHLYNDFLVSYKFCVLNHVILTLPALNHVSIL